MRKLTGVGTPRQAAARFWACFTALVDLLPIVTGDLICKIRHAG